MSEIINNREFRQEAIAKIIKRLHAGEPVQAVKEDFEKIVDGLAATELSQIEQKLISEGLPVSEVERLCDVHAAVFKDVLARNKALAAPKGHPVQVFFAENRAVERLIADEIRPRLARLREEEQNGKAIALELAEKIGLLSDINKHFRRKEDLLFPYLERYGITGPPKVMWGVDDKIRGLLKDVRSRLLDWQPEKSDETRAKLEELLQQIEEMIFKEERILFPMAMDTLSEDEWAQIHADSPEFGFCLVEPSREWEPARDDAAGDKPTIASQATPGHIRFDTGVLSPEEIELIFSHLPVDVTFVDATGTVKFFSAGKDRIFPRPRTVIGRQVGNCHPPASVRIVEQLVEDLRAGRKDREEFWLKMGEKYVFITYTAIRDKAGRFAGVLETTQDIAPLQQIQGEKRIAGD